MHWQRKFFHCNGSTRNPYQDSSTQPNCHHCRPPGGRRWPILEQLHASLNWLMWDTHSFQQPNNIRLPCAACSDHCRLWTFAATMAATCFRRHHLERQRWPISDYLLAFLRHCVWERQHIQPPTALWIPCAACRNNGRMRTDAATMCCHRRCSSGWQRSTTPDLPAPLNCSGREIQQYQTSNKLPWQRRPPRPPLADCYSTRFHKSFDTFKKPSFWTKTTIHDPSMPGCSIRRAPRAHVPPLV